MSTNEREWLRPRPAHWANDILNHQSAAKAKRFRFGAMIALATVIGSFWIALKVMDYAAGSDEKAREAAIKELRPTSWQTFGKASYEIRDGMVIMQGPNHIFTQLQCGSLDSDINFSESEVKFSIFLERAGEANMQLMFRNAQGNPIGEPAVQDLGGMTKRMVELRAKTRPGTRTVQALIYSPRGSEAAVFNDPFFGCAPGD